MSKLIKIQDVWINPERVQYIYDSGKEYTTINFTGMTNTPMGDLIESEVHINMPMNEVAEIINGTPSNHNRNEKLKLDLGFFNISARTYNILKSNNINTLEDLLKTDDFLRFDGLGRKSVNEIKNFINSEIKDNE